MKHSYLRLHVSIILAGATGLFGKIISISELPLVFYRVVFSAMFLALVMGLGHRLHRLPGRQLAAILGCGVLLSVHWVCYYGSIKLANVSIGAICFALVGFFTALVEPLVNHHKPSWRELMLSLITVAGVMLIFGFDTRYRVGIVALLILFCPQQKSTGCHRACQQHDVALRTGRRWSSTGYGIVYFLSMPARSRCYTVGTRLLGAAHLRRRIHNSSIFASASGSAFYLGFYRKPQL